MINRSITLRGLTQFRSFLHPCANYQSRCTNTNYADQYTITNSNTDAPPYLLIGQPSSSRKRLEAIPGFQRSLNRPQIILNYANPQAQFKPTPKASGEPQPKPKDTGGSEKPTQDQIMNVYNVLQETLPKLFIQPMDYKIYAQDIVFINNISNKTTYGLMKYVQQIALLRTVGHFKFAYVRFEIVSMGQDPDEGRITVKWRIAGISGLRVMLKFWKYKLWKWTDIIKQQETWYDGVSYYDVGPDGLIYRHIADKIEEDRDRAIDSKNEANTNNQLAPKLAMMTHIVPMNSLQSAYILAGKKYHKYLDSKTNTTKRPKRLSYI